MPSNLKKSLMGSEDVIRISGYVTRREDFPSYMAVRDRCALEPKPVSTLTVVAGFTRLDFWLRSK